MHVSGMMNRNFKSSANSATIRKAGRQMRDLDIGTVTDRDITIRATAQGRDPDKTTVSEVMSIAPCRENNAAQ